MTIIHLLHCVILNFQQGYITFTQTLLFGQAITSLELEHKPVRLYINYTLDILSDD